MSTLTGGTLNLVKPELTDDHKVTIGTDLPANFQKIDDNYTALTARGLTGTTKNISNTDLNSLVANGFYSGNNLTNAPDTGFYYVEVIQHGTGGSYIMQRITGVNLINVNKTFQRVKDGTTWTGWVELNPAKTRYNNSTELQTQLQIKTDGTGIKSLYSLKIDNLKSTDMVILLAQVEITNPQTYNVGIGRQLLACSSSSATTGSTITGIPAVMENVTPDLHHGVFQVQGIDTGRTGTIYYNLVGYAVYSSADGTKYVTVEAGYGGITALVIS